jgi:hypothetical protein
MAHLAIFMGIATGLFIIGGLIMWSSFQGLNKKESDD